MKILLSTAVLLAALGSVAYAQDINADRAAVMRANGAAVGALRPLTSAFAAAAVKVQAQILAENGNKIAALFAPGTDQSHPQASPAIWTDAAGFKAAAAKFTADANALMTVSDGAGLTTALATLQSNCAGCHKAYRITPPPRPAQ
jgi:cytochrome c556